MEKFDLKVLALTIFDNLKKQLSFSLNFEKLVFFFCKFWNLNYFAVKSRNLCFIDVKHLFAKQYLESVFHAKVCMDKHSFVKIIEIFQYWFDRVTQHSHFVLKFTSLCVKCFPVTHYNEVIWTDNNCMSISASLIICFYLPELLFSMSKLPTFAKTRL